MEQLRIFYDATGHTITVWFDDPALEHVCQETAEEVILMKDRDGRVIGFEKLNFTVAEPDRLRLQFETVSA